MLRTFFYVLLSLFACTNLMAQPEIVFKKKVINVGTIYLSDKPSCYKVVYFNKGNKPLIVSRYAADCPCTTILSCDTVVAPYHKGTMVVRMDLSNLFPMDLEKLVMMDTNASGETEVIKFVGELKEKKVSKKKRKK